MQSYVVDQGTLVWEAASDVEALALVQSSFRKFGLQPPRLFRNMARPGSSQMELALVTVLEHHDRCVERREPQAR